MRVEYSRRALSDIRGIAAFYAGSDDPRVGERVAPRIQEVVARIAARPESGRPVIERPGVRVAPLLRYRYNIFYAVTAEGIRILRAFAVLPDEPTRHIPGKRLI